ncbi:MAG TPA: addiction module protein [Lacipirellulaceae bacterium]|nr:addiction module protein [Lacipirellulaceae bacterium]
MSDTVLNLYNNALSLSEKDRAELAGLLLGSLDTEVDINSQSTWSDEIAKRLDELNRGRVTPIPWEEVRRCLKKNTN